MCGRFTLRSIDRLAARFTSNAWSELPRLPVFEPRYNIAPTQEILTITESQNERAIQPMVWGLIPSWSSEAAGFINARAETLIERRSFSESFQRRRCLVPADGFYEWQRNGKLKQPYYFQLKDEGLFAFAGIWDEWRNLKDEALPNTGKIISCSIITTRPNELLGSIHDRMPVILPAEAYDIWLNEDSRPAHLMEWLAPYPAEQMKSFPVSQRVNYAKVDDEELVQPVEVTEATQGTLF